MTALYGGSFDPLTKGHEWVIEQASQLFRQVIVGVATNAEKKYLFSIRQRMVMVNEFTRRFANVKVVMLSNKFLIKQAKELKVTYIIRGIRNEQDFLYEQVMRNINHDIQYQESDPIETVFLMPPRELAEVSSSTVKALVGPQGWEQVVGKYVSPNVMKRLQVCSR